MHWLPQVVRSCEHGRSCSFKSTLAGLIETCAESEVFPPVGAYSWLLELRARLCAGLGGWGKFRLGSGRSDYLKQRNWCFMGPVQIPKANPPQMRQRTLCFDLLALELVLGNRIQLSLAVQGGWTTSGNQPGLACF